MIGNATYRLLQKLKKNEIDPEFAAFVSPIFFF